ncbi:sensor domain-containing diguanylate cyclase [Aliidiomarina sp. Khilg15.8]
MADPDQDLSLSDTISHYASLMKTAAVTPGIIFQFELGADGEMRFPYSSPKLHTLPNAEPDTIKRDARSVFEAIHKGDVERVKESIYMSRETMLPWTCDYRVHHEGRVKWVRGSALPEEGDNGAIIWSGMIMDITDLKTAHLKLQESERRLEEAQKLASLGNWYANLQTGELYWSDIVYQIFGLNKDNTSLSIDIFNRHVHPDDLEKVRVSEERAKDSGIQDVEHRIIRPDGDIRWVHELAYMKTPEGVLHGTIQDITERKLAEHALQELATTDPLTKLYNRRFFQEHSVTAIQLSDRLETPAAVVMFDLDHFKKVNDTYGHATGDQVLQKIAEKAKSSIRKKDILGRIGGEEFAITLPGTTLLEAAGIADKLRKKISQMTFEASEQKKSFSLTCSFGVTVCSKPGESVDALLARADEALYAAKHNGRNRVEVKN